MVKIVDSLKEEFPMIQINDCDKNGKQYATTRWLYPKGKDRYNNVFLEIWEKPKAGRYDFVIYRDLLTPSENAETIPETNMSRGILPKYNMSDAELLNFVRGKIKIYCDNMWFGRK